MIMMTVCAGSSSNYLSHAEMEKVFGERVLERKGRGKSRVETGCIENAC